MSPLGRIFLKGMGIAAAVALLLVIAITLIADFMLKPSRNVVQRVLSPSGALVATVIEINGGATTSFGYEVRVTGSGLNPGRNKVALLYAARRNEKAYGLHLRWATEKELLVEYLDAKWTEVRSLGLLGPDVRVILRSRISDPSAPPGGMLYNLHKGRQEGTSASEQETSISTK